MFWSRSAEKEGAGDRLRRRVGRQAQCCARGDSCREPERSDLIHASSGNRWIDSRRDCSADQRNGHGVKVAIVNLMTMEHGGSVDRLAMGAYALTAVNGTAA